MMAAVVSQLSALDARVFLFINRSLQNPLFDLLMPILSAKRYFVLPAAVLVAMLLTWGGRRMWAVLAVGLLALAVADQGTNLIKAGVQRTRPCHAIAGVHLLTACTRSFSFPSNHASNMFAIATVGWLTLRRFRGALLLLAAGVAYSRVYLGAHYPGDVLAGALWGAAVGWSLAALAGRIWPGVFRVSALRPKRPPAPARGSPPEPAR